MSGEKSRRLLAWHGLPEGEEVIALVITAVDTVNIEEDIEVGIIATRGEATTVIVPDILPVGGGTNGYAERMELDRDVLSKKEI